MPKQKRIELATASDILQYLHNERRTALHNMAVYEEGATTLEQTLARSAGLEPHEAKARAKRVCRWMHRAAEDHRVAAINFAKTIKSFEKEYEAQLNPKKGKRRGIDFTR